MRREERQTLVCGGGVEVGRIRAEERRRFAADLHDGLLQLLAALLFRLRDLDEQRRAGRKPSAGTFEAALEILRNVQEEVRRISRGQGPAAPNRRTLLPAIRELVEEWSRRTSVIARLRVEELAEPWAAQLPPNIADTIYWVLQEALMNVEKHAGASRVEIELAGRDGFILLTVSDDGEGFRVEGCGRIGGGSLGTGLLNLRQRAWNVGGRLTVISSPGLGTSVCLCVPCP